MIKKFNKIMEGFGEMPCPGCGDEISISTGGTIRVIGNVVRDFEVPGFWTPNNRCNNPMCGWSDIE